MTERKTCPLCCGHGEVSDYVYMLFNRSIEFLKTKPENGNGEKEAEIKKETYTA